MTRTTRAALIAAALIGITAGLGAFTFVYAKGYSYLTNDPAACANCHVMSEYYAAWQKGSHRTAATCNDCHTPHDLVGKYTVKAKNGFWHSFYFTTGRYPDPIRITSGNQKVTEGACRDCHDAITDAITPARHGPAGAARAPQPGGISLTPARAHGADDSMSCVRCHATVGHWVRE